jgi:two-component system NarL family sensor kinase
VERSINQLHEVVRSIRSFIFDLRPRQFSGTLAESLVNLAREFEQNSQIATEVVLDEQVKVPLPIAIPLYHIAHESLSNVQKHSAAKSTKIRLVTAEGTGLLEVWDDGVGFDASAGPPDGHHGLRNVTARADMLGATLTIESAPGKGTSVTVAFSLRPA